MHYTHTQTRTHARTDNAKQEHSVQKRRDTYRLLVDFLEFVVFNCFTEVALGEAKSRSDRSHPVQPELDVAEVVAPPGREYGCGG